MRTQTIDELVRTPLLTHEVGSLDKPSRRVKGFAGKPLTDGDVEQARTWGERLGVQGHEELLRQEILGEPGISESTDGMARGAPSSSRS